MPRSKLTSPGRTDMFELDSDSTCSLGPKPNDRGQYLPATRRAFFILGHRGEGWCFGVDIELLLLTFWISAENKLDLRKCKNKFS